MYSLLGKTDMNEGLTALIFVYERRVAMPKGYADIKLADGGELRMIIDIGKRKNISLRISEEGTPEIRVPYGCSMDKISDIVNKNINWIRKAEASLNRRIGLPKTYQNGELIRLLGKEVAICHKDVNDFFEPKLTDNELLIPISKFSTEQQVRSLTDKFISELAYSEISACMKEMIEITGLMPEKVTVKQMSASWGRCISNKHISINSKVIVFDRSCIRYVCLHELCHLVHMNHSAEFWSLVGKYCPDYKRIKQIMKN